MMSVSASQYRVFTGTLYPDSTSYDCDVRLQVLKDTFPEFATCIHDRDVTSDGQLKKAHIHWVGRLKNATTISGIAARLALKPNEIEAGRSFKALVRYLIHLDDPDKAQYDSASIKATFAVDKYLKNPKEEDSEKAAKILGFIVETHCTSMMVLMDWCIKNGCWDCLRRGGSLFRNVQAELASMER